jgi:hypothetical protein
VTIYGVDISTEVVGGLSMAGGWGGRGRVSV